MTFIMEFMGTTATTNVPFFFGPLQITASSGEARRKPIDMTARFSSTYYSGRGKSRPNTCDNTQLQPVDPSI